MSDREGSREGEARAGGGREDEGRGGERPAAPEEIPAVEWVVAAFGLLLVCGAVGYMLYSALWGDKSPPDLSVSVESVRETSGGYLVTFRAVKRGGSTAAGVLVEGQLKGGAEEGESSETTLDFLPSHSERRGGLFFTKDPRRYELKVRAQGYQEP